MANAKKLAVILLFALFLRLINLSQSLWLDEAIGALVARDYSYSEIIANFISFDNHPPFYYLFLKFWTGIFGYSEIALRGPSVIFGLLTVLIVYKANKLAALLLAASQIHVYYSQEARMYAMAAFLATVAVLYFAKAIQTNKNCHWCVFSFALVAMMLTDYMPVFLLPVFPVYLYLQRKKAFSKLALSFFPLVITGLFWSPVFVEQIKNYSQVPNSFLFGGATLKQAGLLWMKFVFGRISFEPKILYYLLAALASYPSLACLLAGIKRKNLFLWLWFLIPIIAGFLASLAFPAFSYFRFLFVLPAFYILIAKSQKKFLIAAVLMFNILGLFIYYKDIHQQREQWRQAVDYVESKGGGLALFEFPEPFAPYLWYSKSILDAKGATDSIRAGTSATEDKTRKLLRGANKIYHFDYLKDVSDPDGVVQRVILESGFKEIEKTAQFVGVGAITTYEKVD